MEPKEDAPELALSVPGPGSEPGAGAGSGAGGSAVHGFVRTESGEPVGEAILTLVSPGGSQVDRVESLADGSYILSAPAGGAYMLAATAGIHEPWVRHIMIGGDPLVHDVVLSDLGVSR